MISLKDYGMLASLCNIYEVRPLICRLFKCNWPKPPFKDTQLMAKEDREVMNVRVTFFN